MYCQVRCVLLSEVCVEQTLVCDRGEGHRLWGRVGEKGAEGATALQEFSLVPGEHLPRVPATC